jgi:hypothetical protein
MSSTQVSGQERARQLERESRLRVRLGVPGVAAGVLYVLGGVIVTTTLSSAPTIGVLQSVTDAFEGHGNPAVSERAAEVRFISHHAFGLIAGSVLAGLALAALTAILLFLFDAVRLRRPQLMPAARPLVLVGGSLVAVLNVAHQVVGAINTHKFVVGHDFTNHAVDQALTKGAANLLTQYLALLAGLALAIGMITVVLNAMRVGLVVRWVGILGIVSAVLIFFPLGGATLEVVPAFWLVAMGILFAGRWPGGDPPAWAAGEARPWPSQAEMRAQREAQGGRGGAKGASRAPQKRPALASGEDIAPEPVRPSSGSASRRRRKRGRGT